MEAVAREQIGVSTNGRGVHQSNLNAAVLLLPLLIVLYVNAGTPYDVMPKTAQVETVRCVISVKGMDEQLGVMSTAQALARAQDEGLDLVMISADADPPVVKIIDYGKYK